MVLQLGPCVGELLQARGSGQQRQRAPLAPGDAVPQS